MPTAIGRDELRRVADEQHAVVAEVLPESGYAWAHLAGAIHLPLKGWDPEAVKARLDPDRPVVGYCNDHQ
ncbi:MAG: rhodanese-like domain-containing protein [Actinomycetota bacterium]|nr:rhodanese-like domain-containing protein [Actinomycetota bacterium]